jgi:transcription elongation factor Elf1
MAEGFPEDWEYSGGTLERTLKVLVTCPHCKYKFETEIGESWYSMGFTISCLKCGRSFPINVHGKIVGAVEPKHS